MDYKAAQQIILFLQTHFTGVEGIYLFGSRADDTATASSDYDVAFLLEKPKALDPVCLFDLAAERGGVLGADVDLVDL